MGLVNLMEIAKKIPFKLNRPTLPQHLSPPAVSPTIPSSLPSPLVHWVHIDMQDTVGQVPKERTLCFKAGQSPIQGDSSGTSEDSFKRNFQRGYSQGFIGEVGARHSFGTLQVPFTASLLWRGHGDRNHSRGSCLFKGQLYALLPSSPPPPPGLGSMLLLLPQLRADIHTFKYILSPSASLREPHLNAEREPLNLVLSEVRRRGSLSHDPE